MGPVPLDPTLVIYMGNWNLTLTACKIIICDIYLYEISRSKTRPTLSLGSLNFAVSQSKLWGGSLSVPPALFLANWLAALSLTFHVNAVCFKRLTADPAWCIV